MLSIVLSGTSKGLGCRVAGRWGGALAVRSGALGQPAGTHVNISATGKAGLAHSIVNDGWREGES